MKKIYSLAFILFTALTGMAQTHPTNADNAVVLKDSLHIHGNAKINGYLITRHIKSPDGVVHIGDSSMTYTSLINQTNPIKGISTASMEYQSTSTATSGMGLGWSNAALGAKSMALGYGSQAFGDYSLAFGAAGGTESDADFSTTIGWNVKTTSAATKSMALGSGYVSNPMTNSIANSLAVGFNSNVPTFFVSGGAGTTGSLGRVGIGTTLPLKALNVNGDVIITSGTSFPASAAYIRGNNALSGASTPDYTWAKDSTTGIFHPAANTIAFTCGGTEKMRIKANGDICINVPNTSPGNQIYFRGTGDANHGIGFYNNYTNTAATYVNGPVLYGYDGGALATKNGGDKIALTWDHNGYVHIGPTFSNTNHSTAALTVGGDVVSKAFYVTNTSWSDFVFDKSYPLMPLYEVEKFYTKNHHLPDVPSEKQIQENGNNLGQTDAILLQKIEELTLYMVQQQKQIDVLVKQNKELTEKVNGKK